MLKYLTSLLDPEFKAEVIKILKKLRKIINRNTDYYNKELDTIKRNQSKLESGIAKIKTIEAMNSRINNAEEWVILEDRIMEITYSKQQIEGCIKWKQHVKSMG